jgi:subfamily B ATP-binding cassette protein MsbA
LGPHRRRFFAALIFGIIYGGASGFGIPVIFQRVFRQIFETGEASYSTVQIVSLALLIPVAFFVRGLFGFFSTYWMTRCGLAVLQGLRGDIFAHLQRLHLQYFDAHQSGDLINRVVSDPRALQDLILEIAAELFKQPLQMTAAFVALVYLSIQMRDIFLLLIFLLLIPLCFFPVRLLRRHVKQCGRAMQAAEGEMTQRVSENLRTAQEVRAFGLENLEIDRLRRAMCSFSHFVLEITRWQKMQQPVMEVLSAVILSIIFVYAYFQRIPFSAFSAMGMGLYFAFDPIKKINSIVTQIHRATGSLERIFDVVEAPVAIVDPEDPIPLRLSGAVEFRDVTFRYGCQDILRGVSFAVAPRTTCALVGPSGAGKTTLIRLIPRLYDVSGGQVCLDGVDIRQLSLLELRDQIGFVPQQTVLLNDTVANNIRMGRREASDDEVVAAAKAAYAHDFLSRLECGYDTCVGDGGNLLSGGQRQRVAIARALIRDSRILILDEATSALDAESEDSVKRALEHMASRRTIVVVAHRLSTVQNADQIVVIDGGLCVASGTHGDLLVRCALYAGWVERQGLKT